MPEEKCEEQRANVRTVHVGIGHDDDSTVAQLRHVETALFLFAVAIDPVFTRFADARANGGDHRLDLRVLEKLIFARLFNVDQLSANRKDRLITAIASLLGGAAG